MKRRELIRLLGGAAAGAWAFPASAQHRPRISILHGGFPKRTAIHLLFEALGKLGYGDTDIDLLGGEGDPVRLKALVDQFGARRPVVIAITTPAAIALKEAKLKIPVVFATVADPVGLGIVEIFSHPGGDFTGVAYSEAGIGGKWLELLVDAIAGMTRVAVLWSASKASIARLESIRTSACGARRC
jgi:putative ABC transport system substrate-binding protein